MNLFRDFLSALSFLTVIPLNPDFAIGVRTETSEADTFSTKKERAMQGHRTNFLRKEKCGIVRRIPRPIANSGLKLKNSREISFARSMAYFPAVGFIVGALIYLVYLLLRNFLPPSLLAVVLCGFWIYITGTLHLEGFADMVDGFSASRQKDKILEVMSDKNIGAKGAVWSALLVVAKTALIYEIILLDYAMYIVAACVLARWVMVVVTAYSAYARSGGGLGKVFVEGTGNREAITATAVMLVLCWIILGVKLLIPLAVTALAALVSVAYFKRKLGGVTGDILGGVNELSEAALMLTLILIEKI